MTAQGDVPRWAGSATGQPLVVMARGTFPEKDEAAQH
jgi:hypothetical protein